MNKQMYWNVFLRTEEPYKGLVWKRQYEYENYRIIKQLPLGNFSVPLEKDTTIAILKLSDIENAILFQVGLSNDFKDNNNARIALTIKDKELDSIVYWHERYLLHFSEADLNTFHAGLFNYELPGKLLNKEYELKLVVNSRSNRLDLKDVSIKVFEIR